MSSLWLADREGERLVAAQQTIIEAKCRSLNMWLHGAKNLPDKHELDVAALRSADLETARAWVIKESLRQLWKQRSRAAGERWYGWVVRSRLGAGDEGCRDDPAASAERADLLRAGEVGVDSGRWVARLAGDGVLLAPGVGVDVDRRQCTLRSRRGASAR